MSIALRLGSIDWHTMEKELDAEGYALLPSILSTADCRELATLYQNPCTNFRSTVDMARFNFGEGQYRYFDYPLPALVQQLREALFPPLSVIANHWSARLNLEETWPGSLDEFSHQCHAAGQLKPTPLLLRYGEGDFNCLHQDLYGEVYFPLQAIVLLSRPGIDFDGGELILVEQRPRMQSRPVIVPIQAGGIAIVPVRMRPRQGRIRVHQAQMRHGVGRIRRGNRTSLGIIFHDAS